MLKNGTPDWKPCSASWRNASPPARRRSGDWRELTQVLNGWLASLSQSDRVLFLRRYWNGEPLKELEQTYGLTHSALAKRMYRLRGSLRKTLEREGYTL